MTTTLRPSVRTRLLIALVVLAAATMVVGAASWFTLSQATARLDRLHDDTLRGVEEALTLSRRASDLATRAPYLLSIQSPFRMEQEAEVARGLIAGIAGQLPAEKADLAATLRQMDDSVRDMVEDASARAALIDKILRQNAETSAIERSLVARSDAAPGARDWLGLQRITRALIGAGRTNSLVSVGEFHRDYFRQMQAMASARDPEVVAELARLRGLAEGPEGLFELRRLELARQIAAEAALARIRRGAEAINQHAAEVTAGARSDIAAERGRTLASIAFGRGVIVIVGAISAVVALAAALFVSGYVTANLQAIAEAMIRLAAGDRSSRLPRGEHGGDEIGKLFHAFRAFRSNTLRLDRSNRQLAARNALFQNLYDGMSDGLAVLSDDGHLVARNSRLAEVLRVEPAALGRRPMMRELLAGAGWQRSDTVEGFAELRNAEGQVAELRESRLATGGSVMLVADVSERRELDDRLQRVQRTEALGKIAGEVAHDFGNILSTITTTLHLLETAVPERAPALRQSLASALDLGTALTQRLLAFARRLHLAPEVMDLNALVEGVEDLIALALDERVVLTITPAKAPLAVRVDPGQMESALLNLCLNAAQAIDGAGEISIRLALTEQGRALIEVADTGHGMIEEVLSQAMEPFFTARPDGTGLGLAMVSGFIRQSGGDMRITSAPGAGTVVRLTLPLYDAPASFCAPGSRLEGQKVLVVEDDPADAAHARTCLAAVGAETVRAVSTVAEAMALLHGPEQFDLVLSDLHLDGEVAGWQVAEAALSRPGRSSVVVLSGRLPAADPLEGRFDGRLFRMAKPLDPAALAARLQGCKTE